MDEADIALRNVTYRMFVELGRAPTAPEVARAVGSSVGEAVDGWRRLHDAHALVLHPESTAIRMVNPFSAEETQYRVRCGGRWWFANCAWDAFGVCAALHADGEIETVCLDCGAPIHIAVRDGLTDDPNVLFHCLVPAARWWDDIGFT